MKQVLALVAASLVFLGSGLNSGAWSIQGAIFCDADGTGVLSEGDGPLANVLVVVVNLSGTYSNATLSGSTGQFSLALPDVNDSYVQFIDPTTLPDDPVLLAPSGGVYLFKLDADDPTITTGFLVSSPSCPAPPPADACWTKASGSVKTLRAANDQSFSGSIYPDCANLTGTSSWTHTAKGQRLQFKATSVRTLRDGIVVGGISYIEFAGTGVVRPQRGPEVPVLFHARIEDRTIGRQADRYYFRAYTESGETLMLTSGDPGNPLNIVPVPISTGKAAIRISSCENPPPGI